MRYQATGELPHVIQPDSPLIRLLENIPPRDRLQFEGVTLTNDLGYLATSAHFRTAAQLLRWLKPDEWMEPASWPAESRRIKSFHNTLTLDDLAKHCRRFPAEVRLLRGGQWRSINTEDSDGNT